MAYKRFTASAKQIGPDAKYGSALLSKFINCMMLDGKKATARRMVYDALDIITKKITDVGPMEVFETAFKNVKPLIEVRSKRVGGSNYQVPRQVTSRRQQSLAIRWIRDAVRSGSGQPTCNRLANELMAAYRGEGSAMTTRENVHRMADANRAFAHFAW